MFGRGGEKREKRYQARTIDTTRIDCTAMHSFKIAMARGDVHWVCHAANILSLRASRSARL